MNKKEPKEKKDRQKDILEKDGTPLELRVAEVFEKCGFIVKKQEPYIDPFDGKHKSIDVLAILRRKVTTFSSRIPLDRDVTVEIRIFIECKYTPDEVILYTEPPERENQEQAFFGSGYESFCVKGRIDEKLKDHRYLTAPEIISTTSNNSENGYGMKAVQQSCHGILSGNFSSDADYVIDYPVVVGNSSEFLSVMKKGATDPVDYAGNLHGLPFEYKYIDPKSHRKGIFYVDMLSYEIIHQFVLSRFLEFTDLSGMIVPAHAFYFQQEQRRTDSNPIF